MRQSSDWRVSWREAQSSQKRGEVLVALRARAAREVVVMEANWTEWPRERRDRRS